MSDKKHYTGVPCGMSSPYGMDTTNEFSRVTCKSCRKRIEIAMRNKKHERREYMDKVYEQLRQDFKQAGF